MELRHFHVLLGLAMAAFAGRGFCETLTCPYVIKTSDEMCSETCQATDARNQSENIYGRILDSYLEYQQVVFVENECGYFAWRYSSYVEEARHIMLSVYASEDPPPDYDEDRYHGLVVGGPEEINQTDSDETEPDVSFRPLPGCCGVPLSSNSCRSEIPITKTTRLFFSLSLFRVRSFSQLNATHCWSMDGGMTESSFDMVPEPPLNKYAATNTSRRVGPAVQTFVPFDPFEFFPLTPPPVTVFEKYIRKLEAAKYDSVCVFDMPKDEVVANNSDDSPYRIDSELFNRGVYHMSGYYYQGDRIFRKSEPNDTVECDTRQYDSTNGSSDSVYTMSSSNPDNTTFTCMVLWTSVNASDQVTVKCMPHNETYLYFVPTGEIDEYVQDLTTVIIVVSSVGATLLLAIVMLVMWRWKRRLHRMLKDTRKVPAQLDDILNDDTKDLERARGYSLYEIEKVDTMKLGSYNISPSHVFGNLTQPLDDVENVPDKMTCYRTISIDNPLYDAAANGSEYLQKETSGDRSSDISTNKLATLADVPKRFVIPYATLQAPREKVFLYSTNDTSADSGVESNYTVRSSGAVEKPCDSGVGTSGFSVASSTSKSVSAGQPMKQRTITLNNSKKDAELPVSREKRSVSPAFREESNPTLPGSEEKKDENCPIKGCTLFTYPLSEDKAAVDLSSYGEHQPASPPLTAASCADSGYPDSPLTYHGDSSEAEEETNKIEGTGFYASKQALDEITCELGLPESNADVDKMYFGLEDPTIDCVISPYVEKAAFCPSAEVATSGEKVEPAEDSFSVEKMRVDADESPYLDKGVLDKKLFGTTPSQGENSSKENAPYLDENLRVEITTPVESSKPVESKTTPNVTLSEAPEYAPYWDKNLCMEQQKMAVTERPTQAHTADPPQDLSLEIIESAPYWDKTALVLNATQEGSKLQTPHAKNNSGAKCEAAEKSDGAERELAPEGPDKRTSLPIVADQPGDSTNWSYWDKRTLQPIEHLALQSGQGNFVKPEVA